MVKLGKKSRGVLYYYDVVDYYNYTYHSSIMLV